LPAHALRPRVRGNATDRGDAAGLLEAARHAAIDPVAMKMPAEAYALAT